MVVAPAPPLSPRNLGATLPSPPLRTALCARPATGGTSSARAAASASPRFLDSASFRLRRSSSMLAMRSCSAFTEGATTGCATVLPRATRRSYIMFPIFELRGGL